MERGFGLRRLAVCAAILSFALPFAAGCRKSGPSSTDQASAQEMQRSQEQTVQREEQSSTSPQ